MKFPGDFYERMVLCVICVLSAVRFTKDLCVFGSHKIAFIYLSPPSNIVVAASIKGLPWNETPSLRWRAASSRVDGNPVDARRGRAVRSVQQIGPCIHPAVLNHIGWEAHRICVWLTVKAPQGKREQRIKRRMRKQRGRLQTEKVVLETRTKKKRKKVDGE